MLLHLVYTVLGNEYNTSEKSLTPFRLYTFVKCPGSRSRNRENALSHGLLSVKRRCKFTFFLHICKFFYLCIFQYFDFVDIVKILKCSEQLVSWIKFVGFAFFSLDWYVQWLVCHRMYWLANWEHWNNYKMWVKLSYSPTLFLFPKKFLWFEFIVISLYYT